MCSETEKKVPNLTRAQLAGMPKRLRDAVAAAESKPYSRIPEPGSRRHTLYDPRMTLTEQRYGLKLAADPKVLKWWFEAVSFTLGRRCVYTPDFLVQYQDLHAECHEVKGKQVWEDSRIKFKWAAEKNQHYRFAWCQWKNGVWKVNYYKPLKG